MTEAKEAARAAIESRRQSLIDLSHAIHAEPELGYKEFKASKRLADFAEGLGFEVELGACDLPTAFVAEFGSGSRTIGLCAEYDALPEIGHACGHNVIASAAMAAAAGLKAVAAECDLTVRIMGTPAEEVGDSAGKHLLLERGAFEGIDIAMMVHPAPDDVVRPVMIAAASIDVVFDGVPSHAAFYPELGVNAADALTISQVAIGLLRQHILPTDRLHGIIVKGGDAANIVPAHTTARYMARSLELADLEPLLRRVRNCFEAGAIGTGAKLTLSGGTKPYADVRHDHNLSELYRSNAEALGRLFVPTDGRPSGSTDMGNVSYVMPSIHPFIGIGSRPAVNHQPGFTEAAATEKADQAILDGGIAMAWTAIDFGLGTQP